jgi:hypothetical protein
LVFNPDLIADEDAIDKLIKLMLTENTQVAGVNLFKDENYSLPDNSIRNFPSLPQFVKSFLGMGNSTIINKVLVKEAKEVDWAAGSFLEFKASHYARLNGFDECYFIYCEDIDICYRSKLLNRTIFSKHFYWHVSSVIRFLMTKQGLTRARSSL